MRCRRLIRFGCSCFVKLFCLFKLVCVWFTLTLSFDKTTRNYVANDLNGLTWMCTFTWLLLYKYTRTLVTYSLITYRTLTSTVLWVIYIRGNGRESRQNDIMGRCTDVIRLQEHEHRKIIQISLSFFHFYFLPLPPPPHPPPPLPQLYVRR